MCNGGGVGSATRGSVNFTVDCMTCPRSISITITVTSGPALTGDNARDVFVMESNTSMYPTCLNPNSTLDVTNAIGRFDSPNNVPVTLGPIDVSSCATNFSVILMETAGGGTDTYTTGTVELICPSAPPCTLPYEEWKYRMPFNVTDNTGSGLTDHWVPINLSPTTFNYDKVSENGSDLRFTEGDLNTTLDYWIETWNTSGDSTVWVKVNVSASSTDTFFMHYGNPCVASESSGSTTSPPAPVNLGEENASHIRTDYFGGTLGIDAMVNTTVSNGDVVLTRTPYDSPGTVTSTNISLGNRSTWTVFYATNHSLPVNTNISYEIRASNGSTLCTIPWAQALLGYNVMTCAGSISPIKLYAYLTTTDGLATPSLQWWGISRH